MEKWQAWLNIAFLIAIAAERWLMRHEVGAAIIARKQEEMKEAIDALHEKASDFASKQQSKVGKMSEDVAVMKTEISYINAELQGLRRHVGTLSNGYPPEKE